MRHPARAALLLFVSGLLLGARAQTPPPQEFALEFNVDHAPEAKSLARHCRGKDGAEDIRRSLSLTPR